MFRQPSNLHASSQESRFATADSVNSANAIDLKGINIAMDQRSLLTDAHLQLASGRKYGLIGRNGVGKSILLKSLAFHWLPGVPTECKVFYLDQLESQEQARMNVIDLVLRADWENTCIWDSIQKLEGALSSGDERAMRKALHELELEETEARLEEAKRLCSRTSGARGWDNRKELLELEQRMENLNRDGIAVAAGESSVVSEAIQAKLDDYYNRVVDISDMRGVAEKCLLSLGLDASAFDQPLSNLSGGWRMRVAFAMALFVEAQILLLDEPTNNLDLPGILWLKQYVKSLKDVTVVIVSHDRNFLNDIVEEIVLFQGQKLTYHLGNYDTYVETQAELKIHRQKQRETLGKKQAHIEQSIQAGMAQARKASDSKKMAQMASRKKKLNERFGLETNELGHRFKLNRDMVGYFLNRRSGVEDEHVDPDIEWVIPVPSVLRTKQAILQVEDVYFQYQRDGPYVLQSVTLTIEQGEKIAFVGANGQGKSTLLALLVRNKAPGKGMITAHPNAKFSFFNQHYVDEARSRTESPLAIIASLYPTMKEQEIFNVLGSFGLQGSLALQPLQSLSGGQVVRFALASMTLENPHCLILDEPTNHLDIDSIEALAEALLEFSGTVILVSHDAYFVNRIASDNIYLVKDATVTKCSKIKASMFGKFK